jgi:hypothetical protein
MRITLLGVLGFAVVGAILLYVAKQIHNKHERETVSGCPTTDPNPLGRPIITDTQ